MNFGTAYLDGSGIYGATPESADKLREFDGGFLKVKRQEVEITLEFIFISISTVWVMKFCSHCFPDDKYRSRCWCCSCVLVQQTQAGNSYPETIST